jgi:hypothetical protein
VDLQSEKFGAPQAQVPAGMRTTTRLRTALAVAVEDGRDQSEVAAVRQRVTRELLGRRGAWSTRRGPTVRCSCAAATDPVAAPAGDAADPGLAAARA